jgi:hypothetical protein
MWIGALTAGGVALRSRAGHAHRARVTSRGK